MTWTDTQGSYHYDRLGDIVVLAQGGRLYGTIGAHRAELVASGGDEFTVDWIGEGEPMPIKFTFSGADRPIRIDWGGRVFDRVP